MSLTVGTNTWLSLADAETYMVLRLNADAVWSDSVSDPTKEAALATAYFQLTNDDRFGFPDTVVQVMKDGQCEQALFLLQNQGDMDARMGLRAQGVKSSTVVGESYADSNGTLPVPVSPRVQNLLKDYGTQNSVMGAVNLLDAWDTDELS